MIEINKRLRVLIAIVVVISLIPLVVMQFSSEVNWTVSDFLIASILLFGTIFFTEFILRTTRNKRQRILLIGAVLLIILLFWMELAVGVFGTPLAGR